MMSKGTETSTHNAETKVFTKEDVERSKILRHIYYNPFNTTLENERQRYQRALERYNDACKLHSDIGPEDFRNILLQVFDSGKDITHRFQSPSVKQNVLGHGVKIEALFQYTYEYNIKILDSIYIKKNYTIDNADKIEIRARTYIKSNVTILTTDVTEDLVDRKGASEI